MQFAKQTKNVIVKICENNEKCLSIPSYSPNYVEKIILREVIKQ